MTRAVSLFFANSNQKYQPDVVEAGIHAWHRWLDDAFGSAQDRLLLVGVVGCGPCFDMEATLNELAWVSDHGFVGTFLPGFTRYPGQPPLFDEFWEPFWSFCEAGTWLSSSMLATDPSRAPSPRTSLSFTRKYRQAVA